MMEEIKLTVVLSHAGFVALSRYRGDSMRTQLAIALLGAGLGFALFLDRFPEETRVPVGVGAFLLVNIAGYVHLRTTGSEG